MYHAGRLGLRAAVGIIEGFRQGYAGDQWQLSPSRRPDAICADLLEAAQVIEGADASRRANGC